MATQSKYETHIKPRWDEIQELLERGAFEKDIARHAGVSRPTWDKAKKEHEEFARLIKDAQETALKSVAISLHDLCVGIEYTEERAFKCHEIYYDDSGRRCEKETVEVRQVRRFLPPNLEAIRFYLVNKDKANYSYNPHMVDAKKEELKLRAKEIAAKEF